jgi:hypothetical protein
MTQHEPPSPPPTALPVSHLQCSSTLHVVIGSGIRNANLEFFSRLLGDCTGSGELLPATSELLPAMSRREERDDGSTGLGDTCSSLPSLNCSCCTCLRCLCCRLISGNCTSCTNVKHHKHTSNAVQVTRDLSHRLQRCQIVVVRQLHQDVPHQSVPKHTSVRRLSAK